MIDLISEAAGGEVVAFNDEFFAEAANLLKVSDPVWREGVYTDRGKWMDGWETRRRREPGHDWCLIRLGIPGMIRRVMVDTSHFTGNYPAGFSLEGSGVEEDTLVAGAEWEELIPTSALEGDSVASFEVEDGHRITHVRLNIYPDGGVARLRVLGRPIPHPSMICPASPVDLVSAMVGGEAISASDMHYSQPANLLRPTPPVGMWDGWETRRRRGPGHDWADFRLGLPGTVESVVVDTTHFKGNSPGWVSVDLSEDGTDWHQVISEVAVEPDTVNQVDLPEPSHGSFLRLSIHPDGGVARLRVLGRVDPVTAVQRAVAYLDSLFETEARRWFTAACSSSRWVAGMMRGRPHGTIDAVLQAAEAAFDGLIGSDWMEAFAGHPRIGERGDHVADREQAGTASASRRLLDELAELNRSYEEKFGFTYIVYATGKTAEEMAAIARARLGNTREEEIANAALEQRKITRTRLSRMLCQEPG